MPVGQFFKTNEHFFLEPVNVYGRVRSRFLSNFMFLLFYCSYCLLLLFALWTSFLLSWLDPLQTEFPLGKIKYFWFWFQVLLDVTPSTHPPTRSSLSAGMHFNQDKCQNLLSGFSEPSRPLPFQRLGGLAVSPVGSWRDSSPRKEFFQHEVPADPETQKSWWVHSHSTNGIQKPKWLWFNIRPLWQRHVGAKIHD